MQRARAQNGLVALLVVAVGLFLTGVGVAHFTLLDGIDGAVLSLLFEEDTVHAAGYTDKGFRAVRIGMRPEEVERLLGKPLEVYEVPGTGKFGWRYARSARNSHYRIRSILFGPDGVVIERFSEFYVD